MPGPWSLAMIDTPWRSPFWTRLSVISPFFAYIRILRAISEIAAAMTVCSPLENPATAASARPCCLASTTSTSAAIVRRSSSPTAARALGLHFERALLGAAVQEREAFLQVQHGGHALQGEPELHHREGDIGLDAHDHRLGPAQARHVSDVAQGPDCEGIHDVEGRHVDDDTAAARPPDLGDQRFAKVREIGVSESGLNRRNEVLPLPQNRYFHCVLRSGGERVSDLFPAGARRASATTAAHDPPAVARPLRYLPASHRR